MRIVLQNSALNQGGRDLFIDFIKAYSIICVLLAHALSDDTRSFILFPLWGGMQVPLFYLIQGHHILNKEDSRIDLEKLAKRIILPFIIVQIPVFLLWCYVHNLTIDTPLIRQTLREGGKGPGAYFVWIYLQLAIIISIMHRWIIKMPKWKLLVVFVIVCIVMDISSTLLGMTQWLYRLSFTRYFFLSYLSLLWVKEGIVISKTNIALSVFGISAILFFIYSDIDLSPVFFSTAWTTHRWICYFYVSNALLWGLSMLYNLFSKSNVLSKIYIVLAKNTYEIYLVQMAVFLFAPSICLNVLGSDYPYSIGGFLLCVSLSIVGGIILHFLFKKSFARI